MDGFPPNDAPFGGYEGSLRGIENERRATELARMICGRPEFSVVKGVKRANPAGRLDRAGIDVVLHTDNYITGFQVKSSECCRLLFLERPCSFIPCIVVNNYWDFSTLYCRTYQAVAEAIRSRRLINQWYRDTAPRKTAR